jgi:hypothetical protein
MKRPPAAQREAAPVHRRRAIPGRLATVAGGWCGENRYQKLIDAGKPELIFVKTSLQ